MFFRRNMPICPDYPLSELIRTYLGQLVSLGVVEQKEDAFCLNAEAVRQRRSLQVLMDEDRDVLEQMKWCCDQDKSK